MSLPPAPKDISEHPAKGSVVDPVNIANKEADVDRKIRFYGVIEAFRKGKLPSNAQIDRTLQYVLEHSPVDVDELSPEGRKLIQETRDIINTARLIVQEKNADELFQNFIWHTRSVETKGIKPGDLLEKSPVNSEKLKTEGDEALVHLRSLLTLILTNSEVRKLIYDFSLIGRDLLAKGAVKAAEIVAPLDENLREADKPARGDQFKSGGVVGPDESTVLEQNILEPDKSIQADLPEDQILTKLPHDPERPVVAKEQEKQSGDEAGATSRTTPGQGKDGNIVDQPVEEKKKGVLDKMKQLRNGLSERIPQDYKDAAHEKFDRAKRFLSEEYFPETRRDQFIFRLKKVIIECQLQEDYQQSITWLLDYVKEYGKRGRSVAGTGKERAGEVVKDENLKQATREIRTLLERFANGVSLDIVINAVDNLIDHSRNDEALREWFSSVDGYLRRVLLESGYVLEPDCNSHGRQLRENGRQFYDEKYRADFDNLFDSIGTWFKAFGDDPLNKQFGEDWVHLTRDLLFDSEGSLKFKPDLWSDIRRVILPTLIKEVGYIPIPRIEYTDDSLDLVVENLALQGRNIFPNIVQLEAFNFVKFSPYNTIKDDYCHRITLTLEQMQADMRDVAFYYHKKTGLPKMKDSGLADVLLGGDGLTVTINLVSTKKDQSSVFRVNDIDVKIGTLKFAIRDSKHDFLYKTLRPLATVLVKRQIQKAIKDALRTGLEYIDGQLVAVRDRMAEAKAKDGESRTDVLKELFKQKKDSASIKTSDSHSHFKVVTNKRNSLLASQGHPAGWVNRTADVEKQVGSGTEWKSDAFTIM